MSLLSQVKNGKEHLPPRLLLYGWEGVGKSTCGNTAPAPIFIDAEAGLAQIDCARFPQAKSFDDVIAAVEELRTAPHSFKTVVLDNGVLLRHFFDGGTDRYPVRGHTILPGWEAERNRGSETHLTDGVNASTERWGSLFW